MIRIFSYSRESNRMETPDIGELPRHLADRGRTIWVDLEDPNDEETGVLGGIFGFHILAVEDCIDDAYLPKLDRYDGYTYMIFHAADPEGRDRFQAQKVDVFVGPNFIVTHHRSEIKGIFDTRGVVAKNPGTLLRSADWPLHGILNAMIDNYLPAVTGLESRVERAEAALSGGDVDVADLVQASRELLLLERLAKEQLQILTTLATESDFVHDDNRVYFCDVADHLRHIHHRADYHGTLASAAVAAATAVESGGTRVGSKATAALVVALVPPVFVTTYFSTNFAQLPGSEFGQGPIVVAAAALVYAVCVVLAFRQRRWL